MNPDKQGCFSLLQEEVLAGYLNKNLPIEPRELSFSFSPASLQLKEASGAEERGAVLGLVHFKAQKQCFKIETQLENSTCFIQSSSYSPDSIIYKNDKEINSPESESRKKKKERLMAGLKEIYLIGGLAACSAQPSINGEDWVPQTRILVPQLLQRLLQHVLFLKQHGDCTIVIRSVSWF